MYEFKLRPYSCDVYDIYIDGKRIRDENDLCIRIREARADVVFFNAYTAHDLLDTKDIIYELIDILMMMNNKDKWHVCLEYDYPINKELDTILNNI